MGKFLVKETATGFVFHLVAGNGETIGTSEVYTELKNCKNGIESVKNNAGSAVVDLTKEESGKCPKYEVYEDKGGKFRFRLIAKNGQAILASQGYKSKDGCMGGIESVKKNAPQAEIVMEEKEEK